MKEKEKKRVEKKQEERHSALHACSARRRTEGTAQHRTAMHACMQAAPASGASAARMHSKGRQRVEPAQHACMQGAPASGASACMRAGGRGSARGREDKSRGMVVIFTIRC